MVPVKPSARSVSAARSPAREAPTMTMFSSVVMGSDPGGAAGAARPGSPRGRSAFDGDGLLGAASRRLDDLRAERLVGLLLEDVEEVVIAHLEHLGRDAHADRVALAQV